MAKTTIHDVARMAGVSHASVTRFFKKPELLSVGTRRRVERAIQQLQYIPNAAARSLHSGRSGLVSFIVTDITSSFYTTMMQGVEVTAQQRGYSLLLGNTDESIDKESNLLRALVSHRVDGVILTPAEGQDHCLDLLEHHGVHVVLVDRELPEMRMDTILGDSFEGGRVLTFHLIERGYRDIAFVGGQPGLSSLEQRLSGYKTAVAEARLEPRVYLGRYDMQSGEEIFEHLLAEHRMPRAIVAANSKVAIGILAVARQRGLRIPEDLALTCVDDIESASIIDPFMTVTEQPAYEIGRLAMEMLVERINGSDFPPRKVVLPVRLVVRRSS